jgi:hypothetical protein
MGRKNVTSVSFFYDSLKFQVGFNSIDPAAQTGMFLAYLPVQAGASCRRFQVHGTGIECSRHNLLRHSMKQTAPYSKLFFQLN